MTLFFNWIRRGVRDAVLGGVSDAVVELDAEAQKQLGENPNEQSEALLGEIFPKLLGTKSKATSGSRK